MIELTLLFFVARRLLIAGDFFIEIFFFLFVGHRRVFDVGSIKIGHGRLGYDRGSQSVGRRFVNFRGDRFPSSHAHWHGPLSIRGLVVVGAVRGLRLSHGIGNCLGGKKGLLLTRLSLGFVRSRMEGLEGFACFPRGSARQTVSKNFRWLSNKVYLMVSEEAVRSLLFLSWRRSP